MDSAKIDVEVRTTTGKGVARRTRAAGKVPATIYGHKQAPISVSLDPLALLRSMDKQKRRNTVFTLNVTDNGKSESVTAMVRDAQIDPLSRSIQHIDFIRIDLDEEMKVEVPLILRGTPVGIVNGGNLHQSVHELSIAAKPNAIPAFVEIDVSGLDIGDVLHVSDLKFAPGVRALEESDTAIASVVMLREEKEPTPAEGVVAEGAAPAEGAAAAPGAAGAATPEAGKEEGKKK